MKKYIKSSMYDYFETEDAVYSILNGKYYKHLKEWDRIPSFKYYKVEISMSEYLRAFRTQGR